MTAQLPPRERRETATQREPPEVLFEEARRRRRRRWMAGTALAAGVAVSAFILSTGGGGGGGAGAAAHRHPSGGGAGASSGHASSSSGFSRAPSTQHYSVAETACTVAPRNKYLPAWSGCVTARFADLAGNGRRYLVLIYSRLGRHALSGLPPRSTDPHQNVRLFPAGQAMLRVVTPVGRVVTTRLAYTTTQIKGADGPAARVRAAALVSIAHVNQDPGRVIFLQIGQISSGSTAVAYSLYHGRLISAGPFFGYGGDSATTGGFQCVAGNPPLFIQHGFQLIHGINGNHLPIYGWWKETTVTYAWHGPRLVQIAQDTTKRLVRPTSRVGLGCRNGIS